MQDMKSVLLTNNVLDKRKAGKNMLTVHNKTAGMTIIQIHFFWTKSDIKNKFTYHHLHFHSTFTKCISFTTFKYIKH